MPGLMHSKPLRSTGNGALLVPLHTALAEVGSRELARFSAPSFESPPSEQAALEDTRIPLVPPPRELCTPW